MSFEKLAALMMALCLHPGHINRAMFIHSMYYMSSKATKHIETMLRGKTRDVPNPEHRKDKENKATTNNSVQENKSHTSRFLDASGKQCTSMDMLSEGVSSPLFISLSQTCNL